MDKKKLKKLRPYAAGVNGEIIDALLDDEETEAAQPVPPAGMVIEIKDISGWRPEYSMGNGVANTRRDGSGHAWELKLYKWRYLPSPPEWPEWAGSWVATDAGESMFLSRHAAIGDELGPDRNTHILYAELRPENK